MIRINRSGKVLGVFYVFLFVVIFFCNVLTLKVADDYNYCFSWEDGSLINNVSAIIPSMMAHAQTMNGRLFAHATAQFFLMLPDWIFDVVNTFVFVMQIPLIVKICKHRDDQNNLLHAAIFCAIWVFELTFGQVNLWLDGACNYLWNVSLGLLFIQPYVRYFMSDSEIQVKLPKGLFLLLSFIMGGWGESGSAAFIFIAGVLLLLSHVWQHKEVRAVHLVGIVLAMAGYLSMYLAPAQAGKGSTLSFLYLLSGLIRCLVRLSDIWLLVMAFAVLFILNFRNGTDKKTLVLAGVFFLGSMCANFILIFAVSYPERVALSTTVLLICADAILLQGIFSQGSYRAVAISLLVLLITTAPVQMLWGVYDIYNVYSLSKDNEVHLIQCAENGIKDVSLTVVQADTKYAAVWGLRYLSTDDASTWPNNAMAKYYGIDSIIGTDEAYIQPTS